MTTMTIALQKTNTYMWSEIEPPKAQSGAVFIGDCGAIFYTYTWMACKYQQCPQSCMDHDLQHFFPYKCESFMFAQCSYWFRFTQQNQTQ